MLSFRPIVLVFAVCAGLVAGCASKVEAPAYPQISFAHLPGISLDVARVDVENAYVSPATAPNVEHRFPVSPSATALNWGRDRLKPAGGTGVVRVTVERASVVEVPLERTKGIRGAFTKDQSERYEGVITVAVRILDSNGEERAIVRASTQRSQTVPEDVSLNERDKIWFQMTEKMMATLNESLEAQIHTHLGRWVK